MTENRNYLQKYAMHFGTYMGMYWILKFILFPLAFSIPFLLFLFICLTLAVPFLGYHYAKMYRDKICEGTIGFAHACLFTLFMYMFASLLVAVAHYIYFQFIDHGFIINQCVALMQQTTAELPEMEANREFFQNTIDGVRALSPIDITMQILSNDVFWGSIMAVPTALFVMKKSKNTPVGTTESPQ